MNVWKVASLVSCGLVVLYFAVATMVTMYIHRQQIKSDQKGRAFWLKERS